MPVNVNVAVVVLALVTTAVRPVGTLVTLTLLLVTKLSPLAPVKVSFANVIVNAVEMEPSLATASDIVLAE